MCLHCKGLHISLVCVNIPMVELLLSWLGLFHLSSIINDLLPVVMPCVNLELLTQTRVLMGEPKTFSNPQAQVLPSHDTKYQQGRLLINSRYLEMFQFGIFEYTYGTNH